MVHTSGACFGTMGARLVATSERYKMDTSLVFTVALVAPSEPGLFSAKWHMALPDGTLITCICRKGYRKQALHKPCYYDNNVLACRGLMLVSTCIRRSMVWTSAVAQCRSAPRRSAAQLQGSQYVSSPSHNSNLRVYVRWRCMSLSR